MIGKVSIKIGNDDECVENLLKFSSHVIRFLDLIAPEFQRENLAANHVGIAFLIILRELTTVNQTTPCRLASCILALLYNG